MESHRCEITPGVGVPSPEPTSPPAASPYESCQNVSARGHRCRTPVANGLGLCAYHARRRSQPPPDGRTHASIADNTAAKLLGGIKDFNSPAAVNLFLGNLVKQVVRKRVTRRDAITLAYLSQLILNSLSAISREQALRTTTQPRVIVFDGVMGSGFGPERERERQKERERQERANTNVPQDPARQNEARHNEARQTEVRQYDPQKYDGFRPLPGEW